ncbi:curli assembly protein CsgF [Sansalvadorimonas sp. 2012CJ34-2]|uniref:Curli production assembly/transport component CsgF n=1 Tax=Parendozoicomonas callyspongiae TaxID=2942213 RepID=A0ABT0PBG1_9GAMM|nr:curli assembly protein CsgF [Sansalvadorimonas sp. 2012CJ34-2]MCL6268546.1 curli assembly protein CsgF [Sansalvadorimonas sp. 2012CJ34-2]
MGKSSVISLLLGVAASFTQASELIYTPVNPSFGGNPANGAYLLGGAQAQNDTKAKSSSNSFNQTSELDRFNSSLQSRLLSQMLADLGQGKNNNGRLETDDFLVVITQGGSGDLVVQTTDKNTGESTEIVVNGLIN